MTDNKPKFRLEDVAKIPDSISKIIKEIISEITQKNKLQPARVHNEVCVPYVGPCATQSGHGMNYCDPHCSCNTTCSCNDHCNHCGCVDYCACEDFGGCDCYSDYSGPSCSSDCNFVCNCDVDYG